MAGILAQRPLWALCKNRKHGTSIQVSFVELQAERGGVVFLLPCKVEPAVIAAGLLGEPLALRAPRAADFGFGLDFQVWGRLPVWIKACHG